MPLAGTAFAFTSKKPGNAYKSMIATAESVMKKFIEYLVSYWPQYTPRKSDCQDK
jgi:hypothetical protein